MKPYILAAVMAALPIAAQAELVATIDTTTERFCKRTRHATVCDTHRDTVVRLPAKRPAPEPPRPILPPSREMTPSGVVIMRGMPK